jgi:Asp-tRNA(Asn)/Glu-tRNA(Gln) amidotransferase A subunit family amidase
MALHDLSAMALLAGYRDGSLSPVEAVDATQARIDALEPKLNAMFVVQHDAARGAAKGSEARWRKGTPIGPLDGVPITVKDNIQTKGMPTPVGAASADMTQPWTVDAPPVARLKEAGAIILGKTTMPDFGMLGSGVSSLHGVTRNPWNLARNTAGSSSGAGAAIAAGYGPLALGTDIGGSVRLPAAYCGIFALKPSLGRVPIHPPYAGRVTGPMTRSVTDAALLMNVITRPDTRDYMNLPYAEVDYPERLDRDLKGLRLGFLPEIGVGTPPTPEVRAAIEGAAKAFADAGASVEPMKPFLTRAMLDGLDTFFRARAYADVLAIPPERRVKLLPFIRDWCGVMEGIAGVDLMRAMNQIPAMREAAVYATARYDFVLSPTSPIAAYEAEAPCPGSDPSKPFEHICFTAPFNQSEQPACSINAGFTTDGLPIGLQIVGKRFDDVGVLQMARAWERLRPAPRPWPNP